MASFSNTRSIIFKSHQFLKTGGLQTKFRSASSFNISDALDLNGLLTEEERKIRDMTNEYAQSKLQPRVLNASRNEVFHREIFNEMGQLGLLGCTLG